MSSLPVPAEGRGLVLVAEDEPAIAELERRFLSREGFGVHLEADGRAALAATRRLHPVALVLDVGLPGLDGIEVCAALRAEEDWTPVLFVTARDDEVDRVLGLEIGADDYLTKPFSPRELVARVRAVLRRGAPRSRGPVVAGRLRLDPAGRTVHLDGRAVAVTGTEFNLLAALLGDPGRVFTRTELLAQAWGQVDYGGSSRTVDVHVAQLRAKLGDACRIETVRGVGYKVAAPVPAS